MRCELHPAIDAVGNCVYCGRGVCEDCKVRINNLIHCRECVEAGRVKGGQPVPQQQGPMHPGQMPFMPMPMKFMPRPRGRPKPNDFKIAAFGAVIAAMTMLIMGASTFSSSYDNLLPGGRSTVVIIIIVNIVGLCCMAFGCYGIYWNYGTQSGLLGILGLLIMVPLILIATSSELSTYSSDGYYTGYSLFYSGFLGLMYAVTFMLLHLAIAYARHFIPVFHTSRKVLAAARATNIVGVGFLYTVIILTVFGFLVVGVALILFAIFFFTAPMPDDPVYTRLQPMQPKPGLMPPPMAPPGPTG